MRVAYYGNNLNQGNIFVELLRKNGIDARLFSIDHPYEQEHQHWWTDRPLAAETVFKVTPFNGNVGTSLILQPQVREVYEAVRKYDILMMSEDGPALFSELNGVKKIFYPKGGDIQITPFLIAVLWKNILTDNLNRLRQGKIKEAVKGLFWGYLGNYRMQSRQRGGIRQCDAVISPAVNLEALFGKLKLDARKISYLPLPMETEMLDEIDPDEVRRLKERYADTAIVFFHPTRQFYLKLNDDKYLKDNDKLIYAYAEFIKATPLRTRLLLIDKGRDADLENSKKLIEQLGLEAFVEWLPEMPNKKLRAYYCLDQVVVCDQFNPNLAYMGNIGREAAYYGRLTITCFNNGWNRRLYGGDLPTHVFPAQTAAEILVAMGEISQFDSSKREQRRREGIDWFGRTHHMDSVMPRYIQLFQKVCEST